MKLDNKKAFSEVLDMLNYIEKEYKEKVPKEFLQMFEDECDKEYLKTLLKDNSKMEDKVYSEEALAIIAYLNLKYWCTDSNEKKKYRDMYLKNGRKYE